MLVQSNQCRCLVLVLSRCEQAVYWNHRFLLPGLSLTYDDFTRFPSKGYVMVVSTVSNTT